MSIRYSVNTTLYAVQCLMYNTGQQGVQYSVCIVVFEVYSVQCTMYSVIYIFSILHRVYSVHLTVNSVKVEIAAHA